MGGWVGGGGGWFSYTPFVPLGFNKVSIWAVGSGGVEMGSLVNAHGERAW